MLKISSSTDPISQMSTRLLLTQKRKLLRIVHQCRTFPITYISLAGDAENHHRALKNLKHNYYVISKIHYLRSSMPWKNRFRKRQFNDIYQETAGELVGMGILTCYRVLRQLTRLVLLGSIVIFSLMFGPQVKKLGFRRSTNKKIKVKKYEAIF